MAMSLHRVTLSCPSHLSWLQFPINWGWTELSPQSFPDLTMCDSSWDEAISPSSSLLEALLLSFHKLTKTHTHTRPGTLTPSHTHAFTIHTHPQSHMYSLSCTYSHTLKHIHTITQSNAHTPSHKLPLFLSLPLCSSLFTR